MDRRVLILAACVASLSGATGCQDYNFNPVGHCLIQPGSKRVTLSNISTADVLFVVDDSGSMAGKQQALSDEFPKFLDVLARANKDRLNEKDPVTGLPVLQAIDFHVAVTTTSDFINLTTSSGSTCRNDCKFADGSPATGTMCCLASQVVQPPQCVDDTDCATGYQCIPSTSCPSAAVVWPVGGGSSACFDNATDCNAQPIPCSTLGAECGVLQDVYKYVGETCTSVPSYTRTQPFPKGEYPMGRFVSDDTANAALSPPVTDASVLHFGKTLPWDSWDWTPGGPPGGNFGTTDPSLVARASAFANNVKVGICGSGQEQGLEAARLAVKRVLGAEGLAQSSTYTAGDFLHGSAKLVVVWITDENDCSSPSSPSGGVVFPLTATSPANDGCSADSLLPAAQQRQFAVSQFAEFFTSLGRPFGAAFILSATDKDTLTNACQDQSCQADLCVDPSCSSGPLVCGGQWYPRRYMAFADALRAREADVVVGSICDSFGTNLGRIAEIVKPPPGLVLPTQPAASEVTILRIAGTDGKTRKTCRGPAPAFKDPPTNSIPMTYADAVAGGYDWWFTADSDQTTEAQKAPALASKYVFINHGTFACEANPGETYSADFLGQLPPGGCQTSSDCSAALGGQSADWTCFAGTTRTHSVAVGNGVAATSPDGLTWSARTVPAGSYAAVIWNGAQFVAVGNGVAATSPDGFTWTSRTIPAGNYLGVTRTSGTFSVAVGANVAATSPDGITWTSRAIPAGSYTAVAGNGTQLVAVGSGVAASSPDGTAWTARTIPAGSYRAVAWTGTQFVAVGDGVAATSADGIAWTSRSIPAGNYGAVAWTGTQLVAVGNDVAATSPDGAAWTPRTISSGNYSAAAWNGTQVVAVGDQVAATSPDGIFWTSRPVPTGTYLAGTTGAAPVEYCVAPWNAARGTCICGGRATNCPNNP